MVQITRKKGIVRRTFSDNVKGMKILQIFYDWFWLLIAVPIGFGFLVTVYSWFEPWIKGKTREELEQIEHQNFLELQQREQSKKEQALHAFC